MSLVTASLSGSLSVSGSGPFRRKCRNYHPHITSLPYGDYWFNCDLLAGLQNGAHHLLQVTILCLQLLRTTLGQPFVKLNEIHTLLKAGLHVPSQRVYSKVFAKVTQVRLLAQAREFI